MNHADNVVRTREEDNPELAERILRARREGRVRTIVMAVVAAGLVSMFFGWANDQDQRNRSITNCKLQQEDRRDSVEELDRRADQVLGDPKEKIPKLKFKGTSLEEFKPLILRQARENRRTSQRRAKRIQDCEEVFPNVHLIPFL